LTGRLAPDAPGAVRRREAGMEALRILDGHLSATPFLAGGSYTIADIGMFGYVHVAGEAGMDLAAYPALTAWLERVEQQPGYVNDLEPYPANARVFTGRSIYG
jgi:glutathione S-transferase